MKKPAISIIMPVYNVEKFLQKTIRSVQNQTFTDFEVICVDDGSTDRSVEIIQETAREDSRFSLLEQKNAGAGAARNYGFSFARGEYAIFLDSDDLFSPELLEKLHNAISQNKAQIATCNFSTFDELGNTALRKGIHTEWLPKGTTVFNYKDCPHLIMNIINPTPWNKLYRSDFIRENNLKYEEISSTNDITFAAVSVAAADRITYVPDYLVKYRVGHSGSITSTKTKNLNNVAIAVSSAVRQVKELPCYGEIKNAVIRFSVENYLFALKKYIPDFSADNARVFYEHVHKTFNESDFDNVTEQMVSNQTLYHQYRIIRNNNYQEMKKRISQKLIVSLTTYPGRIGTLSKVLDTIYAQSRPADEIVLWLAESQFPKKEKDLPYDLRKLIQEKRLTVRWCDDLKPHKKYFYALQEYTEDIVVTVDDDLLYPEDMLEKLYKSYLQHPNAVSAMRAHLIVISEKNEILSYSQWVKETDACIYEPSMQLLSTGGAGTLYPPNLYRKEFFDKEAIESTCLWADDLWLKAMQLMSDIPVVVASPSAQLRYLPGSQDNALCHSNVDQNLNDVQLEKISAWLDATFEPGILVKKLTALDVGVKLLGIEALCAHFDKERKMLKAELNRAREAQRAALANPLSIKTQIEDVTFPKPHWEILLIYILAWLPEKILGGLRCWDEQGFSYTVKYGAKKVVSKLGRIFSHIFGKFIDLFRRRKDEQ